MRYFIAFITNPGAGWAFLSRVADRAGGCRSKEHETSLLQKDRVGRSGAQHQHEAPGGPSVLIVEDDLAVASVIEQALMAEGYDCLHAEVTEDALQIMMHVSFDLAVVDIFMRGQGGLVSIQALRRRHPHCRIIATSGGWSSMTPTEALRAAWKLGADETLPKPFRLERLITMSHMLLRAE
ncbi:MAG: response regulator [Proteobacteria bacterium]|nr:response regulator [Pseudomonadota bacterium]